MDILRSQLQLCGFGGSGRKDQEDVTELFLFLMDIFGAKNIPLKQFLFHGGNKHQDDEKQITERIVPLGIDLLLFRKKKVVIIILNLK